MKYPLNYRHLFCRELCCSLRGHVWKSSWRPRANYNELIKQPYDSLPYEWTSSGNAYFEYSPRWRYKCRRCRKIFFDRSELIRIQLWNGIRSAYQAFKLSRKYRDPIIVDIATSISTFFAHQDWMYTSIVFSVLNWAGKIEDQHYTLK